MKRSEMIERMNAACKGGTSKLHMRSESIQEKSRISRIPTLKKELKKKSKLLVITDLAIPFNPETGAEDDTYNVDNKYRPPFSATTVALYLKGLADKNAATKEAFMRRAGVTEWDTSDLETFTQQDRTIFVKYRVPRIFTVPVVTVNIPAITGNDYGRDYSIDIQRDPETGEIVGETPAILKINKLFRDKIYEEIQEYNAKILDGTLQKTDKQQSDDKREIYSKNPVSDDHPSNWITAIELPVTNQYKLSGGIDYSNIDVKTIKEHLVLSRYSKKIKIAITSYMNGDLEKFDKHFDYFEVDMACPTEGDDQTKKGKMDIGMDTTFEKPTYLIEENFDGTNLDSGLLAKFNDAVTEYLDSCENIEEEVRRSTYISVYSEDLESQLYAALPTVLDLENDKYLTQNVLKANKEVISIAFAGLGDEMLDAIEAGVSDAPEGSLNESEAATEAKKYSVADLEAELEEDGSGFVEVSEVSVD